MKRYAHNIIAILLLMLLSALLIACSPVDALPDESEAGDPPDFDQAEPPDATQRDPVVPQDDFIEIERLTIELDSYVVSRGTVIEPNVIILPYDATESFYHLQSSDETVLRRRMGRWTAVGAGRADLIATATNGVTGRARITVTVAVESVSLGEDEIIIELDESLALTPVIYPEDAMFDHVYYTSSDESVATVTEDGTINAVSVGTTEITISVDGVSAAVTVSVSVPVTGISVRTDRSTYSIGDEATFSVQLTPQDAADRSFTITLSGAPASITGDNTFSCDSAGEVTITATAANGVTGSHTVTVIDLAAFADEVFRLTNAERENAGLPPFGIRPELTQVALIRADEISRHFAHDRPDGRSCFTAFEENGVSYNWAGENIAAGQRTPEEAVQGWMDSPGHRANILRREYGHLGVGVAIDNTGRIYWSQNFTD